MQQIHIDRRGTARFRDNKIVRYLLDHGGIDLNALALIEFPREDREQFAQLIGYSVSGYGDLPYVRKTTLAAADRAWAKMNRSRK